MRGSLSPLLFILVMETLSNSLGRVLQGEFLQDIRVGSAVEACLSVSHMFYSDDTLNIPLRFETVSSRLRLNVQPDLIPAGEVPLPDNLATMLGSKVVSAPVTCLHLPLSASVKAKIVWDGVVQRF